mmetsp:Transcript_29079/g.79835  ORF Transcript_29079/g.79835 Transcript_29079/m.79835 type:complete len:226 (-) Transcript_29079:1034-1711(-)
MRSPKTSSSPRPRSRWLCFRTLAAAVRRRWNCSSCFFRASSRKRRERFVTRLSRASIRPMRRSSGLASWAAYAWMSRRKRSLVPSLTASICRCTSAALARASSIISSVSSASAIMSATGMFFALARSGCTCFSTFATNLSASFTEPATSFSFSCMVSFTSSRTCSFSSLTTALSLSRAISLAVPTATLSQWKSRNATPLPLSLTRPRQTLSSSSARIEKSNSPLA